MSIVIVLAFYMLCIGLGIGLGEGLYRIVVYRARRRLP